MKNSRINHTHSASLLWIRNACINWRCFCNLRNKGRKPKTSTVGYNLYNFFYHTKNYPMDSGKLWIWINAFILLSKASENLVDNSIFWSKTETWILFLVLRTRYIRGISCLVVFFGYHKCPCISRIKWQIKVRRETIIIINVNLNI